MAVRFFVTGYDTYERSTNVGLTTNPHDLAHRSQYFDRHQRSGPDMHLNVAQFNEGLGDLGRLAGFLHTTTAAQLLDAVFFKLQAFWIDRTTVAIQGQFLQSGFSYF